MITVYSHGEQVYQGPWQTAPEEVRVYCQHLQDAGYDVPGYFAQRTPTALAMGGYEVSPADEK